MAYEQVEQFVEHVRSVHARLRKSAAVARGATDDDRQALLFELIESHEKRLDAALEKASPSGAEAVMKTWLQFPQDETLESLIRTLPEDPQAGIPMDDIVERVLRWRKPTSCSPRTVVRRECGRSSTAWRSSSTTRGDATSARSSNLMMLETRSRAVAADCAGLTDRGRKREKNEDQFLVADLSKSVFVHQTSVMAENATRLVGRPQARLLVVADGMGGQGGGDTASAVAVSTVVQYVLDVMPWFFGLDDRHREEISDELSSILKTCQNAVELEARGHRYPRMGTTLTMAYIVSTRAYVVHAGDSRAYLFRRGCLRQITKDHTMAQKLVEQEVLSVEKAAESRFSHQLWNAVAGGDSDLAPDVYYVPIERDDVLLLCTDGLTAHVDDESIARELSSESPAEETVARLVALANEGGGSDNITAVVASFTPGAGAS